MLAYIVAIANYEESKVPLNFSAHVLTGDHAGNRSMTRNWRLTFVINAGGAVEDLDPEDYH